MCIGVILLGVRDRKMALKASDWLSSLQCQCANKRESKTLTGIPTVVHPPREGEELVKRDGEEQLVS